MSKGECRICRKARVMIGSYCAACREMQARRKAAKVLPRDMYCLADKLRIGRRVEEYAARVSAGHRLFEEGGISSEDVDGRLDERRGE